MSPTAVIAALKSVPTRAAPLVLGALSVALLLAIAAPPSSAQDTSATSTDSGFGLGGNNKDKPLEISADNGIEWKRDARTYTARGNALAVQGDTSIAADTLIAYLDENDDIAHWEAIGNVKIQTDQSTSYGEHANYQESSRLLVLTGNNLKIVTDKQTVTARDQIEYWRDKKIVVAKGAVVLVRPDDNTTIHSDQATAYFRDKVDDPATPEDESGGSEMFQVQADGHVRVDRKNDQTGFANHLTYDPNTEIAVLTGNVTINSKDNAYTGGRAELDLKNDISRLLPAAGERVKTVITPKNSGNSSGTTDQAAPVTQ